MNETLADFEHPLVRRTAERLTDGKTSARDKLNAIFLFVRDEIEFGFAVKGDLVKASETIEHVWTASYARVFFSDHAL